MTHIFPVCRCTFRFTLPHNGVFYSEISVERKGVFSSIIYEIECFSKLGTNMDVRFVGEWGLV